MDCGLSEISEDSGCGNVANAVIVGSRNLKKEHMMKSKWSAILGVAALTVSFAPAFAQQTIGPDAGAKIRGEVTSSATHQRHAQEHVQILYNTLEVNPKAAPAVLREQAAACKTSLAKSDELLKSVKVAHAKEPEVVKLIDSILKHHADAAAHCDMAADYIKKGESAGKLPDCCADIHEQIEAAKKDMEKLKKLVKAEELMIPQKPPVKK